MVLAVAAELAALGALRGAARTGALLAAPVLGRWAMVASGAGAPSARPDGLGAAFVREVGRRDLAVATVLSLVVVVPAAERAAPWPGSSSPCRAVVLRRFATSAFGGVTGDVLGAAGLLAETLQPSLVCGKPMSKLRSRARSFW